MSSDMAVCRARLLSDLSGLTCCDKPATSADGRLCAFHQRQCQALYRGYKKRGVELEAVSAALPPYLATTKTSIVVQDFKDVEDETTLRELHEYLFRKHNLLEKVIRARKLHHSHFFAIDNDYGHEKYLNQLQNEKHVMARALEKLGQRGTTLMYQQKKWFDWVKQCHAEAEAQRENESRKVKLEALLFKRHQKEIQRHQLEAKAREAKKREERFLEEMYTQRLSEMSEEDQDEWDPVQDVFGYERDNYVDIIKFFLMIKDQDIKETENATSNDVATTSAAVEPEPSDKLLSKSAKKRAQKAKADEKKLAGPSKLDPDGKTSKSIEMETKVQMKERLSKPVKFERPTGWYMGDSETNMAINTHSPAIPDDEIDQLLEEIAEVKHFLFCRLLLSQASLLPIALKANSIEEFLANDQVTQEHLRDLALKLERPGLQDVRDACGDFYRGEHEDEENDNTDETKEEGEHKKDRKPKHDKYEMKFKDVSTIPDKYQTKREKAASKKRLQPKDVFGDDEPEGPLDFGKVTNESEYEGKKMRIKICGRYMYNYPSEKALNRGGWYHFSIIAKDSDLHDAVELCRNWSEFFELNILCIYHYFPAAKWTIFIGDIMRQQLLQLGFIPYFLSDKAEHITRHFQSGSRGMVRRHHEVYEMRNFVCGHMKRDDPVSRRFIQYLSMETWKLRALVRDRKTGKVLIQPSENDLWLMREKSGFGRASRNEFNVQLSVGPAFFEEMDKVRKFHFSFEEYYDIIIWDASPGRSYSALQRKLEETLTRAMRVRTLEDMFSVSAPILKTIIKDPKTERVRTIKPGEEDKSIWANLSTTARAVQWSPTTGEALEGLDDSYKWTEADEIEDAILFPEELTGQMKDNLFKESPSVMDMFERKPMFNLRKFAKDADTGDEYSTDSELDALDTDDGDEEWEDDPSEMDSEDDDKLDFIPKEEAGNAEKAIEVLSKQFKNMMFSPTQENDYFLPILRNPKLATRIPKSIRMHPADFMGSLRFAMMSQKIYSSDHEDLHEDFMRHLDREKSKVFKNGWHMADQQPGAYAQYIELKSLVNRMDDFVMTKITPGPFELCKFMQMDQHFTVERRIVNDAFEAYAAIALFFDTEAFLESEDEKAKLSSRRSKWFNSRNSKLFNQAERALHPPDRRTHLSNKTMPKEFWKEWDDLLKDKGRTSEDAIDDIYPAEWRKAIRPTIIRLFRAGIICNSYSGRASGVVTAKAEPNRPLDLYLDYRFFMPTSRMVSHLTDPTQFDRAFILKKSRRFSEQHSGAKFALLRMWTAPHFYPLMLGVDKRDMCSFLDDRGRAWYFRFIPKDMPYSEFSVHQQLSLRLEPYRDIFGSQVFVAKDLIVVMGKDAKDLRKLAEGVTWAVQTRPWRLEIDFWRSFVNIDLEFMEGLHEKWLE